MHRASFPSSLIAVFAVIQPAFACFCFTRPLCDYQPGAQSERRIFVGTVTDIYPAARDAYRFLSYGERPQNDKAELLKLWRGVLTPVEADWIKSADSWHHYFDFSRLAASRRVRFHVEEWLVGDGGDSVEVFTSVSSCGFSFMKGRAYMVVSVPSGGRWWTGACSGTARVDQAQEDIREARSWRAGSPLAPRVFGQVLDDQRRKPRDWNTYGLPNAVVRLTGPAGSSERTADAQGRFAFDDLPRTKYTIELVSPAAKGSASGFDLTYTRCVNATGILRLEGARLVYQFFLSGGWLRVLKEPAVEAPELNLPAAMPPISPPAFLNAPPPPKPPR